MYQEPADGWTPEEKLFFRLTIVHVYRKISDPTDKFIVVCIQEAGYTQDEIGQMLKISQEAVSKRYKNAIARLRDFKERGLI